MTPLLSHSGTVRLRADGTLRLAAVADTHSTPHPKSFDWLKALEPDAILHAGDIGDLQVLTALKQIAPLHAVRGNIDTRANDLPDVLTLDVRGENGTALRILLTHIAVAGIKLRADAAKLARAQKASLVVCGHSHVPFLTQEKGITVFNPGSIGPRRFTLPIVFGLIELGADAVSLRHIDCETGKPWEP